MIDNNIEIEVENMFNNENYDKTISKLLTNEEYLKTMNNLFNIITTKEYEIQSEYASIPNSYISFYSSLELMTNPNNSNYLSYIKYNMTHLFKLNSSTEIFEKYNDILTSISKETEKLLYEIITFNIQINREISFFSDRTHNEIIRKIKKTIRYIEENNLEKEYKFTYDLLENIETYLSFHKLISSGLFELLTDINKLIKKDIITCSIDNNFIINSYTDYEPLRDLTSSIPMQIVENLSYLYLCNKSYSKVKEKIKINEHKISFEELMLINEAIETQIHKLISPDFKTKTEGIKRYINNKIKYLKRLLNGNIHEEYMHESINNVCNYANNDYDYEIKSTINEIIEILEDINTKISLISDLLNKIKNNDNPTNAIDMLYNIVKIEQTNNYILKEMIYANFKPVLTNTEIFIDIKIKEMEKISPDNKISKRKWERKAEYYSSHYNKQLNLPIYKFLIDYFGEEIIMVNNQTIEIFNKIENIE